jgi:hypothetical protein
MEPVVVTIPADKITDWASFHEVFDQALGFPGFCGRNMDAWIDCMTCVDDGEAGLTSVTVPPGGVLILRIDNPFDFRHRCPGRYDALIDCSASVDYRRTELGERPVLALLLNGA